MSHRELKDRVAAAAQNALDRLRRTPLGVYIFIFPAAEADAAIRRTGFVLRSQTVGLVWIAAPSQRPAGR